MKKDYTDFAGSHPVEKIEKKLTDEELLRRSLPKWEIDYSTKWISEKGKTHHLYLNDKEFEFLKKLFKQIDGQKEISSIFEKLEHCDDRIAVDLRD